MENEILTTFTQIFTNYGIKTFIIVFLTILLINIIKKPIVKKATEYAKKNNCDKSVITCYITYLTVLVVFILNLVYMLIIANFNFYALDWSNYAYTSLSYSAISIATYEAIKKHIQAYSSKKILKDNLDDNKMQNENSVNELKSNNDNLITNKNKKIL